MCSIAKRTKTFSVTKHLTKTAKRCSVDLLVHTVLSPSHSSSAVHVLLSEPLSVYPSSHVNLVILPKTVLSGWVAAPLTGSPKAVQDLTEQKDETPIIRQAGTQLLLFQAFLHKPTARQFILSYMSWSFTVKVLKRNQVPKLPDTTKRTLFLVVELRTRYSNRDIRFDDAKRSMACAPHSELQAVKVIWCRAA